MKRNIQCHPFSGIARGTEHGEYTDMKIISFLNGYKLRKMNFTFSWSKFVRLFELNLFM